MELVTLLLIGRESDRAAALVCVVDCRYACAAAVRRARLDEPVGIPDRLRVDRVDPGLPMVVFGCADLVSVAVAVTSAKWQLYLCYLFYFWTSQETWLI